MDVGKERPVQLLPGGGRVQAAPPLLLRHNLCVARGRCAGEVSDGLAFGLMLPMLVMLAGRGGGVQPTFGSLGQTHTQPAHAALAAHTGGAGAEGVEGDGPNDQRQVEGEVYSPGYVHIDLYTHTHQSRLVAGLMLQQRDRIQ